MNNFNSRSDFISNALYLGQESHNVIPGVSGQQGIVFNIINNNINFLNLFANNLFQNNIINVLPDYFNHQINRFNNFSNSLNTFRNNTLINLLNNNKVANHNSILQHCVESDKKINSINNVFNENDNDDNKTLIHKNDENIDDVIDSPVKKENLIKNKVKKYVCQYEGCGKKFEYKWVLDRHTNSHFCFKLFKCPNCNKSYKSKENLNLHIKNKHLGLKPYSCDFCSSKFSHRNGKFINLNICIINK